MKERRYDIDWLRVIAMLMVFLFHCTRFFCTEDWHVKVPEDQQSELVGMVRDLLVAPWFMQLFFLVSGFASLYSLRHRSAGQFLGERAKRLLIPVYTVGLFILVVPQQYLHLLTHGDITSSFWQWLPGYYAGLLRILPNYLGAGLADPIHLFPYTFAGHLWFIQMLVLVSLVALPALLFLRSERGGRLVGTLAGWVDRRGGIYLVVIPVALVDIALQWIPATTERTWFDFLEYAYYLVVGAIIARCSIAGDARMTSSIKRHGWLCLATWVLPWVVVGGLFTLVLQYDTEPGHGFSLLYVLWRITWNIIRWSSMVFMLSVGAKYLNFTNKLLAYANEAVLPFFLFHQTVILIVGWYVLQWNMGNLIKFLIITGISFLTILLLYEVFVRRIGFMRFLFGMAPQKREKPAPARGGAIRTTATGGGAE